MNRAGPLQLAVLSCILVACAPTVPSGASFTPLAPPGPGDTLVYVYRQDSLRGVDGVEITLDGEKLGQLLNGEYLAFLIDPGQHSMKARMLWFQLIPRSWNSLDFTARPGQTLYLQIRAAYHQDSTHPAGRASPELSTKGTQVGLFMKVQRPDLAKADLLTMRRSPNH